MTKEHIDRVKETLYHPCFSPNNLPNMIIFPILSSTHTEDWPECDVLEVCSVCLYMSCSCPEKD